MDKTMMSLERWWWGAGLGGFSNGTAVTVRMGAHLH